MSKPLSPAAQAVFYAFNSQFDWIEDGVPGPQFKAIAAALCAAADQARSQKITRSDWIKQTWVLQSDILAIAAELEGAE